MNWLATCAVIIPCLNEARTIGALVQSVRAQLPTVIVVDDGSSDATSQTAKAAGAVVVQNESPRGKGAALQQGWTLARTRGFEWVLTMDGDGQHSPADIPALLDCAGRTDADLVIGNRMHAPEKMPFVRRVVNRWMSRRISRRIGMNLPDSQSGFRLIRLSAIAQTPLSSNHFEIESELLLKFARAGRCIEFVPIQVIYKSEQSKIHPVRDTVRWLRWWKSTR
jgi:Glycosyltransferases involved in cell wall biogenesis